MDLCPLVGTAKASIEASLMICQQREHGGLVSLKALDAVGREMDDEDVDHAQLSLSSTACARLERTKAAPHELRQFLGWGVPLGVSCSSSPQRAGIRAGRERKV